ncbi:MAG: endonuclease/exonuclease/phosphatase family protein [Magnetococcales bacterium]|nr:endonuclease/exonuclease/phosphatase family protein [Magnetococcales bacterium]
MSFVKSSIRLLSLLAACVLLAVTVIGFLGAWYWLFDLASHFRYQYVVLAALGMVVTVPMGHRKAAVLFLATLLVNCGVILPLLLPVEQVAPPQGRTVTALSFNIFLNNTQTDTLIDGIRAQKPDLVLLQETKRRLPQLEPLDALFPYSRSSSNHLGFSIFSTFPIVDFHVLGEGKSSNMPMVVRADLDVEGRRLQVLNIHMPVLYAEHYSRHFLNQVEVLAESVTAMAGEPILLMGDLNATPWSWHYREMRNRTGLEPCHRGEGLFWTWPTIKPYFALPIDHCFHSSKLHVLKTWIGPELGSDHLPVLVRFILPDE